MRYNLIDAIEFDKYAVKSYNAIFGTDIEVQDIRDVNKLKMCIYS